MKNPHFIWFSISTSLLIRNFGSNLILIIKGTKTKSTKAPVKKSIGDPTLSRNHFVLNPVKLK
jgi:hypothetical protein